MEPKRHGTLAGWREHKREGTPVCDPCYRAREEYDYRNRSTPQKVRIARLKAQAQRQALTELRQNHTEEWGQLYEKHKALIIEQEDPALPAHSWVETPTFTICTRCGREKSDRGRVVRNGVWGRCAA